MKQPSAKALLLPHAPRGSIYQTLTRACSLCVLLLAALTNPHAWSADPTDQASAQAALAKVTEELNALDTWLTEAERKQVAWQKDLAQQDRAVAKVSAEVRAINKQLDTAQAEIEKLSAEQSVLAKERDHQAARIAHHVTAAFRLQRQDVVKALLNQEQPDDFERLLRYHRHFSDARMQAVRNYQTTLSALDANQRQLETERQGLTNTRTELVSQEQSLASKREQRKDLIASLAQEVLDKSSRRTALQADRNRLQRLIAELSRRARELDGTDFVARQGKLAQPTEGQVIYRYGQGRGDGRLQWEGLVFRAERGTPVRAVFRGRVVFADWLRGFGLLTIIDHGSGYMTLYGYSDDITKSVGDWVESGEVVAHSGQSGGLAFDGLYFEIRRKGSTLDPRKWLRRG